MAGLEFAQSWTGQRVIGNKINSTGYSVPEGWGDSTPSDPTWKMGGGDAKCDWALTLLQPDTSLDLKPSKEKLRTYVQLFKRTEELVEVIQSQTSEQLQALMGLSEKTAKSHADRFKNFHKLPPKQACLIFGGETMKASEFSDSERKFCEAHVRWISGLYGVLRPYDDVKPVRDVPIGGKIKTKRGETVAEYWGDAITKQICKDIVGGRSTKPLLICVMSDEYFQAVLLEELPKDVRVVRVAFEGGSEGATRKVRGRFGRYVVRKRVSNLDELRDFDHEDWELDKFKSISSRVVYSWANDPAVEDKKGKKDKKERGDEAEKPEKQSSKRDKERRGSPGASRSRSPGAGRDTKPRGSTARRKGGGSSDSGDAPVRKQQPAKPRDADRARSRSRSRSPRSRSGRRRGVEDKRRGRDDGSPPRRKRRARSGSS